MDRIVLKKIVEEVVGLEEITVSQDIDIVDDHDDEWVDDRSKPEVEFDDEQQQSDEQDLTNLRVLEWLNEMTSNPEGTSVTIQDVDRESMIYIKTERDDPSWAAQEGQLLIPASNLDLIPGMRSTGTSMDIFVRGVGVGLTHTENLIIKKLRIARETGDLEAETGEEPKKSDIGRVVESYFNLPNEYSSNIILTDSDFILTNRKCAIAITADMSFRTALAADFKREYKNIEFLWKQRPGVWGRSSLTSGGVTDNGKIPMLLGDEGDGEATRRPREPSLVLDEAEGLPRGNGREGAFASSVRPEQRTTASSGIVRACTRDIL